MRLSDPLVRTVMAADGVDPRELRAMLNEIVASLDRAPLQHTQRITVCNELRLNTLP